MGTPNHMATLEDSLVAFYKIKTLIIYPIIVLLGYLLKGVENVRPEACTWMFMAVLFIIAKIWKQAECPSVGE